MSAFSCTQVRDLAPELALGVLGGAERAEALQHVDECPLCRTHVSELSEVADALSLLAPEAEPPAGFEDRVLQSVGAQRGRSWRNASLGKLVAAAAVVLALGTGAVVGTVAAVHGITGHRSDYETIGGRSFRASAMVGSAGKRSGEAFAYDGHPSWVFVSIDYAVPTGTYQIVLDDASGTHFLGEMHVVGGHGTWGGSAPGSIAHVKGVRLVDRANKVQCEATFT
jgi:anti-sigma factor RsiW